MNLDFFKTLSFEKDNRLSYVIQNNIKAILNCKTRVRKSNNIEISPMVLFNKIIK